jgi:dihydroorotate dehydrogenase (NAD+) catalytic subunit
MRHDQLIGLPTKGIGYFLDHQVPDYARFTPPLVASISATTAEDFEAMTREVSAHPDVDVIEVNISCPTRNPGGGNFALHEDHTFQVTKLIRAATDKPVWVKLSFAGDVVAIGLAAEGGGADALVVSNTILGLKINIDAFRPAIGNKFGGISGGIKPIIVRIVPQVRAGKIR